MDMLKRRTEHKNQVTDSLYVETVTHSFYLTRQMTSSILYSAWAESGSLEKVKD